MGAQNRLGVIGGDNAGFPNGRRPGDDVVDIALRVVMGKLCTLNLGCAPADAPAGGLHFTDGAYLDDSFFTAAFPYLKTPITPRRFCAPIATAGVVVFRRSISEAATTPASRTAAVPATTWSTSRCEW